MSLLDYWPTPERVEAVMPLDAAALDDATLLAVHQPVRLRRTGSSDEFSCSESDPLQALLANDPADAAVLIQLVGGAGLGKTHLLRWLEIQARTLRNRALHIVRIAGDATPNQLLEQILANLQGDGYDAIRKELAPRKGPADAAEARDALLDSLKTLLLREKDRAQQRVAAARQRREGPAREDVHLAQWLAEGLRDLLADPETLRQFATGSLGSLRVLDRLAEQIAASSDSLVEFREEDFLKRDDVDVLRAGDRARTCAKQLMLTAAIGKQYRQMAAQLMNRLRDEAHRDLAASAPVPLVVLFDRLRRELRTADRELLLILDDVDPFSGDPDLEAWPFLRALLDSTTTSETAPAACVLRIAIAAQQELVSVRIPSSVEWRIDSLAAESPAAAVASVVEFVGAYLEAGRANSNAVNLEDQEEQRLKEFGRSAGSCNLFPFNRTAIEHLVRRHVTATDGTATLVPGVIVKHVLRDTLLPFRTDFEQGRFPPPGFHGFTPDLLAPAVRQSLEQQFSDDLLARHAVLLGIWGGNPDRLEDLVLSPNAYAAFGLEPPNVPAAPLVPLVEVPRAPAPFTAPEKPAIPELAPVIEAASPVPPVLASPEEGEIRAFLDAVASGGAPLALLTPAVIQWLLEHDEFNAFRIVRSD